MPAFSPDGLWWWDGARWMPTAEIQLDINQTEFERSGRLAEARQLMAIYQLLCVVLVAGALTLVLLPIALVAYYVLWSRAFRAYRDWTLALVSMATTQLLGPDEPMLAGEATVWQSVAVFSAVRRDFAVAVTQAHVLMFWFPDIESRACRVVFAARPQEVEMRVGNAILWTKRLAVGYAGRWWILRGAWGAFKPGEVVAALSRSRQGAIAPVVTSRT